MTDTPCHEDTRPDTAAAAPASPAAEPLATVPFAGPAAEGVRRPRWRAVGTDEARLWTRLGAGVRVALRLQSLFTTDAAVAGPHPDACGEPAWLEIQPAEPGASKPQGRVALVGPTGRLWIDNGSAFLHALTGIALDDGEGPGEGAARAAWLDTRQWLAGAASAALAATGWPVRDHIELVDPMPGGATSHDAEETDGRAPLRRLQLQLRTEDHVFTTHGWTEDAAWVERLRDATPMAGRARLDDAVVQAAVVVARHRLRRGALRALRPGSLIRPTQAWPVDGRGPWRLGAIGWQARLTGQGLELEQMMDNTAYDPTDPPGDPLDSAAPEGASAFDGADATTEAWNDAPAEPGTPSSPALDDLPITLQFEAGQIRLTVAQAARLAPGAVLGLQQTPGPAQVVIRAGGVALGTGELVEVDGRLAVQILRWTGAAATEIAP